MVADQPHLIFYYPKLKCIILPTELKYIILLTQIDIPC